MKSKFKIYLVCLSAQLFTILLFSKQCNGEEFYYTDDCESVNNQFGKCVPLKSCPVFIDLTRRPLIKANLRILLAYTCKFDLEEPKVCCPLNDINETPANRFVGDVDLDERINFDGSGGIKSEDNERNTKNSQPYLSRIPNRFNSNHNDGYGNGYRLPNANQVFFSNRMRQATVDTSSNNNTNISTKEMNGIYQPEALPYPIVREIDTNSLQNKKIRTHPNFRMMPKLHECSNTFKLDRFSGTFGTYPWLALIGNKDRYTKKFFHDCTGTVINKRYILTSAHCAKQSRLVRLGEYNLDREIDYGPELLPPLQAIDYEIESVVQHRNYVKSTLENDIALIRLTKDIDFDIPNVKPVCLPFAKEYGIENRLMNNDIRMFVGKLGWIVGWGRSFLGLRRTSRNGRILEENTVPIINHEECVSKYRNTPMFSNVDTQFCAGSVKSKRTPCVSDRGGPFLMPVKIPNGQSQLDGPKFFQFGINLQDSMSCEAEGFPLPTVYTKVSAYLEWILNNMEV